MKQLRTRQELFTIIGTFRRVDNEVRFVPKSPAHFRAMSRKAPIDKPVACTFYDAPPTRSQAQLNYHFALLEYLSDHTGYTKTELHDAIMRLVFGTKVVRLGDREVEVRESAASSAKLPKYKMQEVIDYDLGLCEQLDIVVPKPEELGYLPS